MQQTHKALWSIMALVAMAAIVAAPATAHPILADPPSIQNSAVPVDYSSVNSITSEAQPTSPQTTVVKETSGFDWESAIVGAVGALGLAFISFMTVRTVRRHGHFPVGSRA
jgi:hypothetical protein